MFRGNLSKSHFENLFIKPLKIILLMWSYNTALFNFASQQFILSVKGLSCNLSTPSSHPLISDTHLYKFSIPCPSHCGSVRWSLPCKPKSHGFDSQSGHMPGLRARSWVGGVQEEVNWCFSPSLSPFPSLKVSG